jgi:hypothetical protein
MIVSVTTVSYLAVTPYRPIRIRIDGTGTPDAAAAFQVVAIPAEFVLGDVQSQVTFSCAAVV